MAKTKISEFSSTPGNNTDIDSINIAEGCAPSGINDAIRELMAQLKDFQTGAQGDSFNGPIGTTTAVAGAFTTLSASGTTTLSGLTASTALALDASKNVVSVTNTGTGNNVLATSPTLVTPILGTPTSVTLTNATGLPISTGVSGLGTGVATFLATPSSANLASAVSDETGSGALVFANSPTLVTPALGTPSALVGTNITGTAAGLSIGGNAATATTATNVSGGTASVTTLTTSSTVTLNGGTANGVAYLNGSKVLTTGSALTFDGTNFRNTSGVFEGIDNMTLSALVSSTNATVLTLNSAGTSGTTRFQINGSEQMRLTSTGLGIGTSSPGYKLTVAGTGGSATVSLLETGVRSWGIRAGGAASGTFDIADFTAGLTRLTLDSSGNLGLGVTPSASTRGKGFDIGLTGGLYGDGITVNFSTHLTNNAYPLANGNWVYKNSSQVAQRYSMESSGQHQWYTAPSGTAGDAISFTQALSLTAAGNLLLGGTTDPGGTKVLYIGNGTTPGTPTSGGVLYVESGALKYKGSSGTVTTLGAA